MSKSAAPRRRGLQSMRCTAPTRRCGCGSLYVRELSAGAAFVPAGFSPGTGDCARGGTDGGMRNAECGMRNWGAGGWRGWHRGSVAALPLARARHRGSVAVLPSARGWPCGSVAALFLGSRSALHSCRGFAPCASGIAFLLLRCPRFVPGFAVLLRLCPSRVWHCVPVAALYLGSRLLFVLRQTGRLAIACVPIPPGRDRHSRVLAVLARLSALAGSLRVWPFLEGDPDGLPGT